MTPTKMIFLILLTFLFLLIIITVFKKFLSDIYNDADKIENGDYKEKK